MELLDLVVKKYFAAKGLIPSIYDQITAYFKYDSFYGALLKKYMFSYIINLHCLFD